MGLLDGKVALVTGASRGIGRAVALELARAGARVAVNYRINEAKATAVANEIAALQTGSAATYRSGETQARAIVDAVTSRVGTVAVAEAGVDNNGATPGERVMLARADVSCSQEVRAMICRIHAEWGRLDILVNNAGITRDKTLRKLADQDWIDVINTNLNGYFYCTSAAIPIMIEQKFGRIVNIGSLIGQAGNIGQANYGAAKGGVTALTKSAALELARFNITANLVQPGFTDTDMFANVPEDIKDQIKAKIPMGRFAKPEEIAKAVLFLVCDGDHITGQEINVNGGIRM